LHPPRSRVSVTEFTIPLFHVGSTVIEMHPVPVHPYVLVEPLPCTVVGKYQGIVVYGQITPPFNTYLSPAAGTCEAQTLAQPSPVLVSEGVSPIIPGACFHGPLPPDGQLPLVCVFVVPSFVSQPFS
jgi:hypothetical protein